MTIGVDVGMYSSKIKLQYNATIRFFYAEITSFLTSLERI